MSHFLSTILSCQLTSSSFYHPTSCSPSALFQDVELSSTGEGSREQAEVSLPRLVWTRSLDFAPVSKELLSHLSSIFPCCFFFVNRVFKIQNSNTLRFGWNKQKTQDRQPPSHLSATFHCKIPQDFSTHGSLTTISHFLLILLKLDVYSNVW